MCDFRYRASTRRVADPPAAAPIGLICHPTDEDCVVASLLAMTVGRGTFRHTRSHNQG